MDVQTSLPHTDPRQLPHAAAHGSPAPAAYAQGADLMDVICILCHFAGLLDR